MDDEGNLGAAIAAGGAVAASAINAGSQERTNRWQLQLAKYSYEQQRQMIAEQNAYNSPLSQLKRYEEAGLNPNLIYGEGKASAGNQSEIAKYNAPNLVAPNVGQIGSTLMDAVRLQMAMEQNNADLRIKSEQANNLKLLGNKYNQDYYTQLLHNIEESELLGFNPGLLLTADEIGKIRSSRKITMYDTKMRVEQETANLKHAQYLLSRAEKSLVSLKADAQDYYIKNIQPKVNRAMELAITGQESKNAILEVEKEFSKADKWFHYGDAFVKDIIDVINAVKPGVNKRP